MMGTRTIHVVGWGLGIVLAMTGLHACSEWTSLERLPHPSPARTIPLESGPGGPILVVGDPERPIGFYLCEILRSEGLNAHSSLSVDELNAAALDSHMVVVLAQTHVTDRQVQLLADWVRDGGNLIAMRPDAKLLPLLGLASTGRSRSEGYLAIDGAMVYGRGLVHEPIQYHGRADLVSLDGAQAIATLYADAKTVTAYPAVSIRSVGEQGGQAAAFAFDLAASVVRSRQGNPAWRGQERDGIPPMRPNDLFYGGAENDRQGDWIDLNNVSIPQADELQRLFANIVLSTSLDHLPIPRFWYLPSFHKAVVLMTGDHHGCCAKTVERFERYVEQSPRNCSIEDWECVRASAYVYPRVELGEVDAEHWHALGFELGVHVDTGCQDWNPATLDRKYVRPQLRKFSRQLPGVVGQASERTHCIAWSDWTTHAIVLSQYGIRLDTNYYYWPPDWIEDRPGHFTGSAMPMRFVDLEGRMIDVYQATTQMTDESEQTYPRTIDTLLERALGPEGYYGVFTANMHMDTSPHPDSDLIVQAALERGIPVVSGRQLLVWLDGRNGSTFREIRREENVLSFAVEQAEGARNLWAMIPARSKVGHIQKLEFELGTANYIVERIKGIEYALFRAESGRYRATYEGS